MKPNNLHLDIRDGWPWHHCHDFHHNEFEDVEVDSHGDDRVYEVQGTQFHAMLYRGNVHRLKTFGFEGFYSTAEEVLGFLGTHEYLRCISLHGHSIGAERDKIRRGNMSKTLGSTSCRG